MKTAFSQLGSVEGKEAEVIAPRRCGRRITCVLALVLTVLTLSLAAPAVHALSAAEEATLYEQVTHAVAGDEGAFCALMKQCDAYKDLVGCSVVPKGEAEVIDNRLWAKIQEVLDRGNVKHGGGLTLVDVIGSGARGATLAAVKN